jgi:hypothetical protein
MSTSTLPSAFGRRLGATVITTLAAAAFTGVAAPAAVAQEGGDIRIHREQVPPGVSKDDPVVCRFYLDAANFGDLPTVHYTINARPPAPDTATVTGDITLTEGAGHTDVLGLADGSYTLEWTWTVPPGDPAPTPRVKIFKVNCREGREGRDGRDGREGREGNDPRQTITEDGRQVAGANGPGDSGGPGGQQGAAGGFGGQGAEASSSGQQGGEGGSAAQQGGGGGWGGKQSGGPAGGVHAGGGGLADKTQAFTPLAGAAAVGLVAVGGAAYFRLMRRRTHGAA